MGKIKFLYTAIYRNPGRSNFATARNHDLFWQGKKNCSLNTEFSQTYSIKSYQVARRDYLIGENSDHNNKSRLVKTTLFTN